MYAFTVDLSRFPKLEFGLREVVTYDADEPDRREKTCAERRITCRAAQQIGMLFDWSFDSVECDGTNNENGHLGMFEVCRLRFEVEKQAFCFACVRGDIHRF